MKADNKQYAVEKSTDKIEEMAVEIEKLTCEVSYLDAEVIKLGERTPRSRVRWMLR